MAREDILNGNYSDPFDLDESALARIDDFCEMAESLSRDLKEGVLYARNYPKRTLVDPEGESENRKDGNFMLDRDRRRTGNVEVHTKKVVAGAWAEDDDVRWPDPEVDAFMDALEQFRQRPESNTGYESKEFIKRQKERWGKDVTNDIVKNKPIRERRPIKKESLEILRKRLREREQRRGN